ncbi:MAG: DNA-3-methyladenine glycosylase 2 family protein [Chitinophagaceae bacterium]
MTSSYLLHLSKDKKLIKIIDQQQPLQLVQHSKIYLRLCRAIMGQQLSTKVATVIYQRFLNLYEGEEPTPKQIAATPFDTLRAIGLSNAKTNYVLNVSTYALEQGMEVERLEKMSNEEITESLTRIKGVGKWTVEMLLMFTLGREDVFAVDDLGIQNAMIRLYKLDRSDKQAFRENMLRISKKWKPYRTYACMHLWQWKDNVPAE